MKKYPMPGASHSAKSKGSTTTPVLSDTTASLEFPVPEDLTTDAEERFLNRSPNFDSDAQKSMQSEPDSKINNGSPSFIGDAEKKVLSFNPKQLTLNDGAFHYHVRAGTYGDIYDEIPWRLKMGLENVKDRSAVDRTCWLRKYSCQTLIHSWNEERRDRQYIKNKRSPPISQYGHLFSTTYGSTIGNKKTCDKERAVVQYTKAFAPGIVPAHQPELDVAVHRVCIPKPIRCLEQDARDICRREDAFRRRAEKAAKA